MEKKSVKFKDCFILTAIGILFNALLYTRLIRMMGLPIPYYLIEFSVIIMLLYLLIDFVRKPYWCKEFTLILLFVLLTCSALYINFQTDLRDRLQAICMDIYICWRFLVILFFGIKIGTNLKEKYAIIERIMIWSARLASIVYLGVAILLYFSSSGWNTLSGCLGETVMIMCVLLLSKNKVDCIFMAAICISQLSIGNARSLAIVAVFLLICLYKWVLKIKYNIPIIFLSIVGAVALGYAEFSKYYLGNGNNSARLRLLRDALYLAQKKIPFGAGFATFCSQAALKWKSPWYEKFSYDSTLIGCTQDSFWACILGQFGYTGVFLILLTFLIIFIMCFKQRQNSRQFASMYLCVCFFVIYSLGGNSIFTAASIVFFVFGFAYSYENNQEESINTNSKIESFD